MITVIDVYVASAIFQSYNPEGRETEERNLVNTMFSQIDCVLFSSRSRIFHSYTDVTISSRLKKFRPLSFLGAFGSPVSPGFLCSSTKAYLFVLLHIYF